MDTTQLLAHLNSLQGGIAQLTLDGEQVQVTWANAAFYRLLELTSGNDLLSCVLPDERTAIRQALNTHCEQGSHCELTLRHLNKDGSISHLYCSASFVGFTKPEKTQALFSCLLLDISAHVHHSQQLQWERERYMIISALSDELLFEYRYADDSLHVLGKPYLSYPSERLLRRFSRLLARSKLCFKDDLPRVLNLIHGAYGAHAARFTSPKFRLQVTKGIYRWHQAIYALRRDEQAQPILIGKLVDVHDATLKISELTRRSLADGLTCLYNQRAAAEKAQQQLQTQPDCAWALLLFDLDHFKAINDSLGHAQGNEVLRHFAFALQKEFYHEAAVMGRMGGDEFMVLMPVDKQEASTKAKLSQYYANLQAKLLPHQVSVGVALTCNCGHSYTQLFNAADAALYYSKHHGRNQLTFYTP